MNEVTNKKGLCLIAALAIILILLLSVGFIRDKQIQKKNNEDYNKWIQAKDDSNSSEGKQNADDSPASSNDKDNSKDKSENTDVYTKIKNKQDIKVVVLGDGLALSMGRETSGGVWQDGLKSAIESKLGVKVQMTSLAQNKSTTKEGLQVVSTANDLSSYDLVITCFGHNDNMSKLPLKDFESNYEKIFSKLKEVNDKVTIIAILPNTLEKNNDYRDKLIEISKKNSIVTADVKAAFNGYGSSEKNLTKDSLPNDTGYQVYTKTIYDTLAKGIK